MGQNVDKLCQPILKLTEDYVFAGTLISVLVLKLHVAVVDLSSCRVFNLDYIKTQICKDNLFVY